MSLKIDGKIQIDATRQEVWDVLFDPNELQVIMNRIPGIHVERMEQVSEDKYEATATMGVSMIKGKYDGTITIVEKHPPEYVKYHGEGKGGGNWTSGDVALTLADEGGKTTLTYAGSGNVSGALASVGQRLIDSVGKQFIQNGTRALAEELASRSRVRRSTTTPSAGLPMDQPPG
jgi:uncharacterized protein